MILKVGEKNNCCDNKAYEPKKFILLFIPSSEQNRLSKLY